MSKNELLKEKVSILEEYTDSINLDQRDIKRLSEIDKEIKEKDEEWENFTDKIDAFDSLEDNKFERVKKIIDETLISHENKSQKEREIGDFFEMGYCLKILRAISKIDQIKERIEKLLKQIKF